MSRWAKAVLGCAFFMALLVGVGLASQEAAAEFADAALHEQIILEVRPQKDRAYVHEAVPVTVTLLVGSLSIRNIQYPRLAGKAYRIGEFTPPRQTRATRDEREYMAYEFSATLVPESSGKIDLGPAELRCDLLAPAGGAAAFFGESEARAVTVRSQPVRFTVLPLPARGAPAGFGGAVGRFTIAREAMPTAIRSGDPVTLTTRIEGVGRLDGFSCPALSLPGVRAYVPTARYGESRLVCEQVLIPEVVAPIEIPELSLSYFDPRRERYQTLKSRPIRLDVAAPIGQAGAAPAVAVAALPAAAGELPSAAGPLLAGVAAAVLLLLVIAVLVMRRSRPARRQPPVACAAAGPSLADWLADADRALAADDPVAFHTAVFRALQAHLAQRHGLPAAAITEEILARASSPAGIDKHRLKAYADLFAICNRSRYAPGAGVAPPMPETLRRMQETLREDQGSAKPHGDARSP